MPSPQTPMQAALTQAHLAQSLGEVPIGAVITKNNTIIAQAHNQPITQNDPTAHAEILAIRAAATLTGNHRLPDTTLYVTLEPCIMCAGAILHARIARLIYAAPDLAHGAAGSALNLLDSPFLNHRCHIQADGVAADQAKHLLQTFFASRR